MKKKAIDSSYFAHSDAPYSHGILMNGMVFTTQIGETEDGSLISEDVYEQTKQTIENAERIIKEAGGTLEDVCKVTIYMLDMKNDFDKMNRAYRELMPNDPFPARACVQVGGMIDGVKVEMEFTAFVGV